MSMTVLIANTPANGIDSMLWFFDLIFSHCVIQLYDHIIYDQYWCSFQRVNNSTQHLPWVFLTIRFCWSLQQKALRDLLVAKCIRSSEAEFFSYKEVPKVSFSERWKEVPQTSSDIVIQPYVISFNFDPPKIGLIITGWLRDVLKSGLS